jgi:hypothetical protein
LLSGIQAKVELAIAERLRRLEAVYLKKPHTIPGHNAIQSELLIQELYERWPQLEESFAFQQKNEGETSLREAFLKKLYEAIARFGKNYISVIQGLDSAVSKIGTQWLQGIVDDIAAEARRIIPWLASESVSTRFNENPND